MTDLQAEHALIYRLRDRKPEALADVYDLYAKPVYSLVLRITRHQQTTEDLVHEVFLRLWNNSSRMDSTTVCLSVWLLATARKMAIDHIRSASTGIARAYVPHLHEPALLTEPSIGIRAALLTLNSNQRQVLELSYFHGHSQTEIAALLTQPLETVKSWMQSALRHLRPGSIARDNSKDTSYVAPREQFQPFLHGGMKTSHAEQQSISGGNGQQGAAL